MKDKLINKLVKLIDQIQDCGIVYEISQMDERSTKEEVVLNSTLAEHLLENGVIVAPMPMASWLLQELTEYVHKRCMEEL